MAANDEVIPLPDPGVGERGFGAGRAINAVERERRRRSLEQTGHACYRPFCLQSANVAIIARSVTNGLGPPQEIRACRVHRKAIEGDTRKWTVLVAEPLPPRPAAPTIRALEGIRLRRERLHDEILDLQDALAALAEGDFDQALQLLDVHAHHRNNRPQRPSPAELRTYIEAAYEKVKPTAVMEDE